MASPPSPAYPPVPFPATTVRPGACSFTIRWLPLSEMYKVPPPSTATPSGKFKPNRVPVPATVVVTPCGEIRRTALLPASAT